MATNKVEIGFDFSEQAGAEFAKLDDAFYGILDAPQTILGRERERGSGSPLSSGGMAEA